jgi:hypothetical protein
MRFRTRERDKAETERETSLGGKNGGKRHNKNRCKEKIQRACNDKTQTFFHNVLSLGVVLK